MWSLPIDPTWREHVPDARLIAICLVALGGCIAWMRFAAWRHRRQLRRIPIRIHVAGTRGKSTTTRLIAAGPQAGRLIVAAEAMTPALQSFAAARRTAVTVVDTAGLPPLQADRALALAVCEAHGVPVAIAGPAMDGAASDPDSFFERALTIGGK